MSVAPMYEPPQGISPAEAGTLLDDTIHPRDITSTMVDLAVRGYIKIEETAEKVLLFTHKDYVFHLQKPREQWGEIWSRTNASCSKTFLRSGVDQMRLSSLKNRFYTAVPSIRQDIMSALKTKGIYMLDPESANGYSIGMVFVILIPFAVCCSISVGQTFSIPRRCWSFAAHLGADLVAVRARDDGEDGKGRTDANCSPGLPGVHESGRRRTAQADAADHVREISRFRDGAGRRASLGTGLRRDRERSAAVVRRSGRRLWQRIQSDLLFELHAQHGSRYAPGVCLSAAGEFQRFGIRWRRWWWRIFRRRIWRRRRKRILEFVGHLTLPLRFQITRAGRRRRRLLSTLLTGFRGRYFFLTIEAIAAVPIITAISFCGRWS